MKIECVTTIPDNAYDVNWGLYDDVWSVVWNLKFESSPSLQNINKSKKLFV